jgi:precorrin-2 dehydrogenase / sirohydrochlorin ferrochelatase
MGYVPLFLAVTGRRCAVIGGDPSAEDRVRSLLAEEASVTVISPTLTLGLREMVERGLVCCRERVLMRGDLAGFTLAYCTAADPAIARMAVAEADARGVLINVLDSPELCRFIAPAVVERGALRIAISTSGASPALAKALRRELGEQFGPCWEVLLTALARARRYLRDREPDAARRAALNRKLAEILRPSLLQGDYLAANAGLRGEIGIGLADLGIELPPGTAAARNAEPL